MAGKVLRIGEWRVDFGSCEMTRAGETVQLEARATRLLQCLAERAGQVVSIEVLLDEAWPGVVVSQDSVYQAVTSLRRVLGDDAKEPRYIATVPRMGYRMVAPVSPWQEPAVKTAPVARDSRRWLRLGKLAAVACVALVAVVSGLWRGCASVDRNTEAAVTPAASPGSVAVLPFLDLTDGMKEEEFADGMTEELIGKLSKVPGLQVPAPTASFYFKGKQVPVAQIANSLGVRYVLDGSVRKAGMRLRVSARLVRAENGYVMWSENYDRPLTDKIAVQDEIAGEVAKALKASIGSDSGPR